MATLTGTLVLGNARRAVVEDGHLPGHSSSAMHVVLSLRKGASAGHSQRGTHCSVHIGNLSSHVLLHAEPHERYTWVSGQRQSVGASHVM